MDENEAERAACLRRVLDALLSTQQLAEWRVTACADGTAQLTVNFGAAKVQQARWEPKTLR